MIEIEDGLYINACEVLVVTDVGRKKCKIYLKHMTEPLDVDREALDVAAEICDAQDEYAKKMHGKPEKPTRGKRRDDDDDDDDNDDNDDDDNEGDGDE